MKLALKHISVLLLISAGLLSCRGQISENPPVRHHFNMNFQERFNAQEENPFFDDGMAMRQPVEGTISRGNLRHDIELFEGTDEEGTYIDEFPLELTREFVYRGQERYDIYCQVCHGGLGDGQGVVITGGYGYVPAPTFHREDSRNMPVGEIYSAITNGIRTMPSYASQIKAEDRWAIVAYVRALQQSQYVPEAEMERYDIDLAELEQVFAEVQERADALAEARAASPAEDITAERGENLFAQQACQACHSLDGAAGIGPTLQGIYESERNFTDGSSTIADEEYLYESIVEPGALVVEGFDNVMIPYSHLSDGEIQSLVEYIKTL